MAARAISSGVISFGLVNIPVKLYSAAESGARISFNQLHATCKGRVKQQLYCPTDEAIVPRNELVKGFEFAKDQYVIFTEEELKALEDESSKTMEIAEFVPLSSVDPLYFETGYYLGPDKGAERAFKLLAVALRETGHAAVAKYSTRGRQNLVLMRPGEDDRLVMQQMRYADEVRPASEVPAGEADLKDAELQLAKQFISQLSTKKFEPAKYRDEYRERVQQVIDQKVKGEAVTFAAPQAAPAKVVDLMDALRASLAKAADRKPPRAAPKRPEAVEAKARPKKAKVAR